MTPTPTPTPTPTVAPTPRTQTRMAREATKQRRWSIGTGLRGEKGNAPQESRPLKLLHFKISTPTPIFTPCFYICVSDNVAVAVICLCTCPSTHHSRNSTPPHPQWWMVQLTTQMDQDSKTHREAGIRQRRIYTEGPRRLRCCLHQIHPSCVGPYWIG